MSGIDEDLYGGGRVGAKRDSESADSGESGLEKKARSQLESVIKKQFALRNGGSSGGGEGIVTASSILDRQLINNARVKAPSATTTKIRGLSIAVRESYLNMLMESLESNNAKICGGRLSKKDILGAGVELEYKIFSANTVMSLYRQRVAAAVSGTCLFCFFII